MSDSARYIAGVVMRLSGRSTPCVDIGEPDDRISEELYGVLLQLRPRMGFLA
ncbi:hypothetical protein [Stenotrophomonas sp. AR026]|uniref:hypothetical protein n=1 Tax=Stenotrophomonas sp. AR026 TaxID=3398462 RepID=UPI003BAE6E08